MATPQAVAREQQQEAMDVDTDTPLDDDSEYEYEEEEAVYIFDFGKDLTLSHLDAAKYECKILGLDGDTKYVQIGSSIFRGKEVLSLGHNMVFSKGPSRYPVSDSDKFDANHPGYYPHLDFYSIFDRRVRMEPVKLKPKRQQPPPQSGSGGGDSPQRARPGSSSSNPNASNAAQE
ncbi:hypothetical protein BC828DRAFT_411860 [Blastocladiella britannica]|nr:hypothetical protein BC828DRAFT_411860 [Blastocladiella britannica]